MRCPYCKEEIQDGAIKCRFCGEFLKDYYKRFFLRWILIFFVLSLILFLLLSLFFFLIKFLFCHLFFAKIDYSFFKGLQDFLRDFFERLFRSLNSGVPKTI